MHQSDNFSFLSTMSRVATRNRRLAHPAAAIPPAIPAGEGEDEDEGRSATERAGSLASMTPDTVVRSLHSQSPGSVSAEDGSAFERSASPADSVLRLLDDDVVRAVPPDRVMAEDNVQQVHIVAGRRPQPPQVQRRRTEADLPFRPAILFVLMFTLYASYRWVYRTDFEYQDGLIREYFGLEKRNRCWW